MTQAMIEIKRHRNAHANYAPHQHLSGRASSLKQTHGTLHLRYLPPPYEYQTFKTEWHWYHRRSSTISYSKNLTFFFPCLSIGDQWRICACVPKGLRPIHYTDFVLFILLCPGFSWYLTSSCIHLRSYNFVSEKCADVWADIMFHNI